MISSIATGANRLGGRTFLLNGLADHFGPEVVRIMTRENARVMVVHPTEEPLNRLLAGMEKDGLDVSRVRTITADSADPEVCRDIVKATVDAHGPLYGLINSGGRPGPQRPLGSIPFNEPERLASGDESTMLQSSLELLGGPWNMARAAAPYITSGGVIINVSTVFSRTAYYGRIPYVVPKAGMNALSTGLAYELGGGVRGVRVNTVFPGPIDSERIRGVFKQMDELQEMEPGSTARTFRELMILERRPDSDPSESAYLVPEDVAATVLWLCSTESAAFSGQSFEVTNGMQVPVESRSKLVSWPDRRLVDLRDKVLFVLAGSDIEEAVAFVQAHASYGARVVVAFRDLRVLERARSRVSSPDDRPIHLLHVDPLQRATTERALKFVDDQFGRLDGVVVLPPASNHQRGTLLSEATDDQVRSFIKDEIVAPVAFASTLAEYLRRWETLERPPAITFVSNPHDGHANRFNDVHRAAVEQMIRVWRSEEEREVGLGRRRFACNPNQIVRFDNTEPDNLTFVTDWSATLTNRVRVMDPINLWVPSSIARATGKTAMPMSIQRVLLGLHQGKTALITGGSIGIGFQLGRFLCMAGARVLLASRGASKLEAARDAIVRELESVGYPEPESRVHFLADIDVADEKSLERLHAHAVDLFGDVDLLINNAGISGAEEMVADMTLEAWNRTMEANLISNYSLLRKFGPAMKRRRGSQVLNVSSYFGGEKYVAVAYPNRADYAVSKAGQRALAEILSRHLGPEIQINALAPGPVDGERLRGTDTSPGLFARRGKLILANKRLNEVHAALLDATGDEGASVTGLLERLVANRHDELLSWAECPKPLRGLAERLAKGRKGGSSSAYLMDNGIAAKLVARLLNGGLLEEPALAGAFVERLVLPPEPFFAAEDVAVQRDKVEESILNLLHLHRMPTDEQVALSTVFYLADPNVSGETFHPSGGLKFDRSVTEGELVGRPGPMELAKLADGNVLLLGEAQKEELVALAKTFGEVSVANIRILVGTEALAAALAARLKDQVGEAKLQVRAIGDDLEGGLTEARRELGRVDVVVSTPFERLPLNPLAGEPSRSWERVLSRDAFAGVIRHQLTHHFRIAKLTSLWEGCRLVLVTPDTSRASTREEFALALFCKTSLHAFTVTLGVEGERLPTAPVVNQVQLTRRSRTEEPATERELQEEQGRFVDAVLQCSLPAPSGRESRYLARIYRGNAVTV